MNNETPNMPGAGRRVGDRVDLQIVGGGLAGLIAANLAVDAGLSVRLLERQRSGGGRAGSAHHQGFTLNQGPHALYLDGALNATLQSLGIQAVGQAPRLKGALGSIGSTIDLLPQGPGSLLRTSLLPARGKRHLVRLMARLSRIDAGPLASVTVDQWIDQLTDVPELRTMLLGLVNLATYNPASDLASADAAAAQLRMAMGRGVIYLAGGWTSIVDALLNRLTDEAASEAAGRFERVISSVSAVSPLSAGSTSAGEAGYLCRTADGDHVSSNVVVAAGLPAVADRLLGVPRPSAGTAATHARRARRATPTGAATANAAGSALADRAGPPVRAAVLDLGLRKPPPVDILLGLDSRLYLSTHSVADRLAPAGLSLVSVARYLGPDEDPGVDETKARLLDHARAAGIETDDIVMERFLHRLTVSGGMPTAAAGGLAGRPGVAVAGRPGLYLAGDWVGDRGLLADAAASSAAEAVAAVVRRMSSIDSAPASPPHGADVVAR